MVRGRKSSRRIALVDGCRTPFAKAGTLFQDMTAVELGRIAVVELLNRMELDVRQIDEVIFGSAIPSVKAPNVAKEVALAAGIPATTPAFTVTCACASANQAITSAAEAIRSGRSEIIIAGGTDSLSNTPMLLSRKLCDLLVESYKGKDPLSRIKPFIRLRLSDLRLDVPALAEPSIGVTLAESAERMAKENGISREAQDAFACRSHRAAAQAAQEGRLLREIAHAFIPPDYQRVVTRDNGIRADINVDTLTKFPPLVDRKYGTVTAGNSSPPSDGASALLIMSEEKAKALGYSPLGYIRSYAFASVPASDQPLMGPAYASPLALDRAGLILKDMDLIEMHEAFAAQVLSNIEAFQSRQFAREKLGREEALGEVDMSKFNVCGGSIALGHPIGATGGRLTITSLNELNRRDGQFGLITLSTADGMGFAMVIERD